MADERGIILATLREYKFNEKAEFIVEDDFEELTYTLLERLGIPHDKEEG